MKSTRKKLIKKLDDIARDKVRLRGKCEICGKTENLQVAHIFSRRHIGVRWDDDNLLLLCYHHHHRFAHENPIEFAEWVKVYKGENEYNKLRAKTRQPTKFSEWDLQQIIKEYGN